MGDGFAASWRNITAQKQAEHKLRQTEEFLAFAVEASAAGVFEVDCATERIMYARRAFELIGIPTPSEFDLIAGSGVPFASIEAQEFWKLIHTDDRDRVREALRRAYDSGGGADGAYQVEYRVSLESGDLRWISASGRVTFDAAGVNPIRLAGLLHDVTDRKREQQAAQQLAAVVETSDDFIGITSIDGNALFVNAAGRNLVGLADEAAARNTRITDYFFPEDVPAAMGLAERVLTSGHEAMETRFRHFVTGEAINVRWNVMAIHDPSTGAPYALATLTHDIRKRKQLEAEQIEISLERDRIAEAIQRSLLLASAPDAYPGVTIQSFYQSAWDDALIGGDFYDVFAISENVIALIVGDATGKGVEAAMYTAEIKFALRAYLREHDGDLSIALQLLNAFIIDNESFDAAHVQGSYVALVAVVMDRTTGRVACCAAGAEPPLILSAESGELRVASSFGPMLGASSDAIYLATYDQLEADDLIAMTTDGITEARSPRTQDTDGRTRSGEFFGAEGWERRLREEGTNSVRDLAEIEQAIVNSALDWSQGVQHDDICLLIARRQA